MSPPSPLETAKQWTVEEVEALNDAVDWKWPRYELVDGVLLVTSAPRYDHQRLVMAFILRLQPYIRRHGVGELLMAPADVHLDARSLVKPDVFVIPPGQSWPGSTWESVKGLVLALEVISPSSARHDRGRKRDYFQEHAVPDYWIVDGDARLVERWRPDGDRPEVLREKLVWHPEPATEPLAIDLVALFAEVLSEH